MVQLVECRTKLCGVLGFVSRLRQFSINHCSALDVCICFALFISLMYRKTRKCAVVIIVRLKKFALFLSTQF